MALSRTMLSGMGMSTEQIETIIEAHTATVEGLKEKMDSYKEKMENKIAENEDLKKQVQETETQVSEWKEKCDKANKDFESYKADIVGKEELQKASSAYAKLLRENHIGEEQVESILGVTDLATLKMDEKGNLVDADKLADDIKTKWKGFIVQETVKGANPQTPPKGSSNSYSTRAEIMAIEDTVKRQQAIKDNPQLFGGQ